MSKGQIVPISRAHGGGLGGGGSWSDIANTADMSDSYGSIHIASDLALRALASHAKPGRAS